MKRRIDILIVAALTAGLLAGCSSGKKRPWNTLEDCIQANTELSMQVQALESENTQLTEQVNTLSTLDAKARLEALDTLEKVRIGKRTGFYDKDDNGTKETLVVYLEPLDSAQDYTKAVGKVNIQLWDLNTAEDKAKQAEWTVEPNDLQKTWGGTIFAGYYRIKLPLKITPDQQREYTVKVTFTDYLTGKVLTDQKVLSLQ